MIRRRHRLSIEAFCIIAMLWLSACSKHEEASPMSLSDEEIAVRLPDWSPLIQSRALLYENSNDLLNPKKGGGNMTLYAHVDGTDNTYIHGVRVWYFNHADYLRWIFLSSGGTPMTYYWPNSNALNFFAFMPDARYNGKDGYESKKTYVTIGSYTNDNGQTFSCDLPPRVGFIPETGSDPASGIEPAPSTDPGVGTELPECVANTDIQEFIYAYHTGLTKENNPVELKFKHPFAQIEFQLAAGSYRMTINRITIKDICLRGTFSTAESLKKPTTDGWTPDESSRQAFTAEINKRIPNELNYMTPLGEPFLVLPQKNEKVTLTLNAVRDPGKNSTDKLPLNVSKELSINWEPGKKYTYVISAGDNNEEIYFNVMVDGDWIENGENNIDVE